MTDADITNLVHAIIALIAAITTLLTIRNDWRLNHLPTKTEHAALVQKVDQINVKLNGDTKPVE